MSDSHTEGAKVGAFCSKRAEGACTCGNRYKKPCKAEMSKWDGVVTALGMKAGAWKYKKLVGNDNPRVQSWGGQAHHALCVASVTGEITTCEALKPTLEVTEWCVNKLDNMIALPMWPMTISWYGNFAKQNAAAPVAWSANAQSAVVAPPFVGLAQHDYDHGLYNGQVNKELCKIANHAKRSIKSHKETAADLLAALENVRETFRESLQGRATDDGWFKGMAGNDPGWWKAFSMVGEAGTERAFPAPNDDKWAEAFKGLFEAFTKLLS